MDDTVGQFAKGTGAVFEPHVMCVDAEDEVEGEAWRRLAGLSLAELNECMTWFAAPDAAGHFDLD
eukprot:3201722-Rhodomonas_salina.1